jgi:hypothetical protein
MAHRIIDTLRGAAGLSHVDWCFVAMAAKELFIARVRHATLPTVTIVKELQVEASATPTAVGADAAREALLARMSWAISAAAARVPWRSDCLLQVMAADRWLRRIGLRPEFFLGVAKDEAGLFKAHAWLRCDDVLVTGGDCDGFWTLIGPEV